MRWQAACILCSPLALEDGRVDEEGRPPNQAAIRDAAQAQETSSDSSSDSSSSDMDTAESKVPAKSADEVDLQNNEVFRRVSSKLAIAQAEADKKDQKIAALQKDFESIFDAFHHVKEDLEKAESELEEKNATIRILEDELARARGYDPMETEWVNCTASWYASKLYSCLPYLCWLRSKRQKCCCICCIVNVTFILKHIHIHIH